MTEQTTDFGFQEVPYQNKAKLVEQVFSSVADKYDIMNDLMSFGIHRVWKRIAISHCAVRKGHTVLDLAGGTGDLSRALLSATNNQAQVILADINHDMLQAGKKKLLEYGIVKQLKYLQLNAESLPFDDNTLDCVVIAFGLRNVTNKQQALNEMYRVLKPAGRVVILEFSKPVNGLLTSIYDAYSFKVLPILGGLVAKDSDSYRYLAESIRKHPPQDELLQMVRDAGFAKCNYFNLTGGICAIHKGFKL